MQAQTATYLDAAIGAARAIRATGQETEHGLIWLPDPDRPDVAATITPPQTIYSGSAGIVLFFLELAQATGDQSWLEDARRSGEHIAATWHDVLAAPTLLPVEHINLTIGMGLAGTAFVLGTLWQATGEQHYSATARDITQHIVDQARPAGAGVEWIGAASAGLGDGAIVLYLLWAATAFEDDTLRALAVRAGRRIVDVAERDEYGNLRWVGFPVERIGMAPDTYMPNFEFGTAGVAYVLARLYEETGDIDFLEAARSGARHVQSIATLRDDAAMLFYRAPDLTDLYYLGYCHGPVGTARLFYLLHRLTGEPEDRLWLQRFARAILLSGVPERQTPGLWNVVCQCCGTAGIFDFFTSLWAATAEPEYLAFARRVAESTLSRESHVDGTGYRWYQAWTRTEPWNVAAETGYMIGAAGVGSAFLHLHLAEHGQYAAILLPDNPFPRHATG
jgi:lantibiotic modifying enzyme